MEYIYFLAPSIAVSCILPLAYYCCIKNRIHSLESRVTLLESSQTMLRHYQAPIVYDPVPSAPVAIHTDLEWGVRVV